MFWFYSKQTIEKQKLNPSLNVQFQKNVMGLASQLKKNSKQSGFNLRYEKKTKISNILVVICNLI